jgi:serine/threonine protein kinase
VRSSGEVSALQVALNSGYLTRAQLAEAERVEAELAAAGRSPGLLALLSQRCLTPAQVEVMREAYRVGEQAASGSAYDSAAMATRAADEPPPVGSGVGPAASSTAISSASSGATWIPGARVDAYVLGQKLGQGGMGVVFRAQHADTGQAYAIKALPIASSSVGKERFRREGAAMATVDRHPNVLRVHSAGEALGHLYLVMDLAPGGDLRERIERHGPLGIREAAALTAQLARGLAHVHAQGILHRDLKPANVLFDSQGVPKLVDFGLARREDWESLTRTGAMVGTPAYMPPEQIRGQKHALDERADVYGLGAVLYHLLTGDAPFQADSLPGLLSQILHTDPSPPSALREGLDPDLDAVALRALAREPGDRYPSAAAFAEDLERVADGEPAEATLPGPWVQGLRRLRRTRRTTLAALVSLALLAGAGAWVGLRSSSSQPTDTSQGPQAEQDVTPEIDWAQRARAAQALLERARNAAARLDVVAVELTLQAQAQHENEARVGVAGVASSTLAAWRGGQGDAQAAIRVLEGLQAVGPLPLAATAPYLEAAAERELELDWPGLAELMIAARRIDPHLELPDNLGVSLVIQAGSLIHQGEWEEGSETLMVATRAGLQPDFRGGMIEQLRRERVFDEAVERDPDDWAARYWRGSSVVAYLWELDAGARSEQLKLQCLQDLELVLAAPDLALRFRSEARTFHLRAIEMQSGAEAAVSAAERLLADGVETPWSVAMQAARSTGHLQRNDELLAWIRRAIELFEADLAQDRVPMWALRQRVRAYEILCSNLLQAGEPTAELRDGLRILEHCDDPPEQLTAWLCWWRWLTEGPQAALAAVERARAQEDDRYLGELEGRLRAALGE